MNACLGVRRTRPGAILTSLRALPSPQGKTLLAKAIAAESGAFFLNLNTATVMNKFVGESQKLVQAVFSLAEKLAPTVVFIDEIE